MSMEFLFKDLPDTLKDHLEKVTREHCKVFFVDEPQFSFLDMQTNAEGIPTGSLVKDSLACEETTVPFAVYKFLERYMGSITGYDVGIDEIHELTEDTFVMGQGKIPAKPLIQTLGEQVYEHVYFPAVCQLLNKSGKFGVYPGKQLFLHSVKLVFTVGDDYIITGGRCSIFYKWRK